jgi:hypothetical protein
VPRKESVPAFSIFFGVFGFAPSDGEQLEEGLEKVALFANPSGTPTHVARQLPSGLWTSKLGTVQDIEHDLRAIVGAEYGKVIQVFQRATVGYPLNAE